MKTINALTLLLGALLIASLPSCKKDPIGTYSPKKKIQKIFVSMPKVEKIPYQDWEWNDKQLNTITHYTSHGQAWVEQFTYENNRIARVDNYTESEYLTYNYDGDRLKSVTVYYRNVIVCTWAVTYTDKKISKLAGTIYDDYYKKDGAEMHLDPLAHLFPTNVCERIELCRQQQATQRRADDTYTINLLLTWEGDNISKIIYTGEGDYVSFELEYDNQHCPMYGLLGSLEDYIYDFTYGHTCFSKNNATRIISKEGHEADTLCFAYQYDADGYPLLQTAYFTDEPDEKNVLYYEY